jgi:hypothetical protein
VEAAGEGQEELSYPQPFETKKSQSVAGPKALIAGCDFFGYTQAFLSQHA